MNKVRYFNSYEEVYDNRSVPNNCLIHADCLKAMTFIETQSVDMILTDLPYGTTDCRWDTIIPLDKLWNHYLRVIKPNGAIVLTATQPFSSTLVMSNINMFKYQWIWHKSRKTNFPNANRQPLRNFEDVLVFYTNQCTYNPQGIIKLETGRIHTRKKPKRETVNAGENDGSLIGTYQQQYENYPSQVLYIESEHNTIHPTQKPLELFEYMIRTYTNKNEVVLDSTAGSCTTAIAAIITNRRFICIEKDEEHFAVGKHRINSLINSINQ